MSTETTSGESTESGVWTPPIGYDLVAQHHDAGVDFDPAELNRLLDDLGVSQEERRLLSGIDFAGYLYSHDDSDPTGRYDIKKMRAQVRVLKRVGLMFALTRKRKLRSTEEINRDLIEEIRHFVQHLGHLATGQDYQRAMNINQSNRELEDEAGSFADDNARRYQLVRSARLNTPRYKRPTNS